MGVLFAEGNARVLLVLHFVIWMRGFWMGRFVKLRATRRFAVITLSLYLATFLIGNIIYPIYKVRVRAEYFDDPSQVVDDYRARMEPRGIDAREAEPPVDLPLRTAKIARWFDVKEHWVALGLSLSAACCLMLLTWDPNRDGAGPATVVFLMALGAAASVWFAAVVGALTTSYRSIGGLG